MKKRRLLSIVLSLCMVLALMPQMVLADSVTSITYLDASGAQQTCNNATVVTSEDTTWGDDGNDGWYVAQGDVIINNRVTVDGDVHLILADGCKLTVNGGISVNPDKNLTIYGQKNGTGELNASAASESMNAGIGGVCDKSSGYITINGGNITAVGDGKGSGIGGGGMGAYQSITINGGTVTSTGGQANASSGIGAHNAAWTGGIITISGGTVMATGGYRGINASSIGTISTGDDGHAVIFASHTESGGSDFYMKNDKASWSGVVFEGDEGKVYGSSVTPSEDFTIPADMTLTIESGKTLTIPAGKTLTNKGKIYVDGTFTGTADNLYYPLSYTISPELLVECTPIVDGKYDYNDKTYGKAGSDVTFRGFPTLGENQVFKLVATTRDGKNTVATKSSSPSISMPFASTSIDLEMITDCIITLDCNGGNLNDEGFLRVDDSDVLYCLDNKTDPLPTDITRLGYIFGGWYDNWYLNGEPVVDKKENQMDYWAKWIVDEKPVLTGLEKGKNYCEDVIFSIADDDNIQKVELNGKELTASEDGKYTIKQGAGEVTLMFIGADRHTAVMTLTVYNGHDFGAWKSNGDDTHTRICKNDGCGFPETKDCTGGKATCTSKAKCEYCGAEYGKLDSSNHRLENIHAKDATVTETGNIEYWKCLDCGRLFADENVEKEISLEDTVIKKLTPETDGDKDQSTKADAEDSVKTGDDTNLALWLALMLLSGAGITGAGVYTRRKRTNE